MGVRNKYFPVVYEEGETVSSSETPAYQWDKGVILVLGGIEVPEGSILQANCHFDTQDNAVTSLVTVQNGEIQVAVPDIVMTRGVQVFATVQLTKSDSTITIYEARLPLIRRAKPHDYEQDEGEDTIVDDLISAVNDAMALIGKFANVEATLETSEEIDEPTVAVSSTEDTTTFNFTFPQQTPITTEEIEAQINW